MWASYRNIISCSFLGTFVYGSGLCAVLEEPWEGNLVMEEFNFIPWTNTCSCLETVGPESDVLPVRGFFWPIFVFVFVLENTIFSSSFYSRKYSTMDIFPQLENSHSQGNYNTSKNHFIVFTLSFFLSIILVNQDLFRPLLSLIKSFQWNLIYCTI